MAGRMKNRPKKRGLGFSPQTLTSSKKVSWINIVHLGLGECFSGLTVCYVGSAPWILNASLQENILFGQPLEKKR